MRNVEERAVAVVRGAARRLSGGTRDYDELMRVVGDAKLVLLGEASHGTKEFYRERGVITKRLMQEKGFAAVAVEGDFADAFRVNRWVRGRGEDRSAAEALRGFGRFPAWMWRNREVVEFLEWLKGFHERELRARGRVGGARTGGMPGTRGFYGLDLYGMEASIGAVLEFLEQVDPGAARRARERYACFDHVERDPQAYGFVAHAQEELSCEEEVVQQLMELRRRRPSYAQRDGEVAEEEAFAAEQNARVVRSAEEYYRTMYHGEVSSWNLRDRHMFETLEALVEHLERRGGPGKVVVWAHNSHLGDARETEMGGRRGELNLGQLVRERWGVEAVLVGFTTHTGTVTAADNWDEEPRRMRVNPGMAGSFEALFHEVGLGDFMVVPREDQEVRRVLSEERLERAIGVIYRPRTERRSHYFGARLGLQFDVVLHLEETTALEPLEKSGGWHDREVAETYPTGM